MASIADGATDYDRPENCIDEKVAGDAAGHPVLVGLTKSGANLLKSSNVKAALQVKLVPEQGRQFLQFSQEAYLPLEYWFVRISLVPQAANVVGPPKERTGS